MLVYSANAGSGDCWSLLRGSNTFCDGIVLSCLICDLAVSYNNFKNLVKKPIRIVICLVDFEICDFRREGRLPDLATLQDGGARPVQVSGGALPKYMRPILNLTRNAWLGHSVATLVSRIGRSSDVMIRYRREACSRGHEPVSDHITKHPLNRR